MRAVGQISLGSALTTEPRCSKEKATTLFCVNPVCCSFWLEFLFSCLFLQHTIPFSLESTCASSSSWGPSSALSSKRRARMLNKGIQAGEALNSTIPHFPGSSCLFCLWSPFSTAWVFLGMGLHRQHLPNSLQVLSGKGDVFSEHELFNCHSWVALKTSFLTCKFINLSFCSVSMAKVSCLFSSIVFSPRHLFLPEWVL